MSEDDLTPEEAADVDEAWCEVKERKAKKFQTVDALLKDLHKEEEEKK